jgi:putative DNA methylase
MREEAEIRIGNLYPRIAITAATTKARPDLNQYVGKSLPVIAYLWARTVKSPDPAFAHVDVPLASTFMLSTKATKQAFIEPVIEGDGYRFTVKIGSPESLEAARIGTKVGRGGHFKCLMSGTPIPVQYIREQGLAGRLSARMMAVVVEGKNGRVFLAPDAASEALAKSATPSWTPDQEINHNPRDIRTQLYGLTKYGALYTPRQQVALATFSDLIREAGARAHTDALSAEMHLPVDGPLRAGGSGPAAYSEAVSVYLALALSRLADYGSSLATWRPKDNAMRSSLSMQAMPMTWDFAEGSPFGASSAGFIPCIEVVAKVLEAAIPDHGPTGNALQVSASSPGKATHSWVISTDPPYYDNIAYADLSDFYYVWLRRSLVAIYPDLFATLAVPKAEELVATPYRHGSEEKAEAFFLDGMTQAMHRITEQAHPAFPVTIYYAFKQSESDHEGGTISTGWDTFLEAVIKSGLTITGTWPMRTEGDNRQVGVGSNALASSIVLVCRASDANAPAATRREFVTALKAELPLALAHLQRGNIAPVDLAQAAIGPGMAVYTRYSQVLNAEGEPLSVRGALALINQTLDEALTEQEGDFDPDTRWALTWFEQTGFAEGNYGVAEQLSKSKNTAISGLVDAGILVSKGGKVRLLKPKEMASNWTPDHDARLSVWEIVHQLVNTLEAQGEGATSLLVEKLGTKAETARELCYRLYTLCERKKRTAEALSYNGLVQSWGEITRLAGASAMVRAQNTSDMFAKE